VVSAYYGIVYSTSSLFKSFSHSSWGWWYWGEANCQAKPLSMDLISNPSCISSWTHSTSSDLCKLPCLRNNLFYTLRCKSARVTLFALSHHPSSSMFKSSTFIDTLSWILGCLIVLPINVFQGSTITTDNFMYLTGRSSILGIFDTI
jgi:hypothetical protein